MARLNAAYELQALEREHNPMSQTVLLQHLPFDTDAGISSRARLGLISLASDYTVEHEFQQVLRHQATYFRFHL